MGAPRNTSVLSELISAMSALHMPAEPVPESELLDDMDFMDENLVWVRHAREHLDAAIKLLMGG